MYNCLAALGNNSHSDFINDIIECNARVAFAREAAADDRDAEVKAAHLDAIVAERDTLPTALRGYLEAT